MYIEFSFEKPNIKTFRFFQRHANTMCFKNLKDQRRKKAKIQTHVFEGEELTSVWGYNKYLFCYIIKVHTQPFSLLCSYNQMLCTTQTPGSSSRVPCQ